jgi:hypothetical protein
MENGKRKRKRKRAEATKGKAGQARRLNTDAKRGKPEREEKRSSGGRYLWAGRGGEVEGQPQAQAWRQPERNPWRTRLFGAALACAGTLAPRQSNVQSWGRVVLTRTSGRRQRGLNWSYPGWV